MSASIITLVKIKKPDERNKKTKLTLKHRSMKISFVIY